MDFSTIERKNEAKWHLIDGTVVEEKEIGEQFAALIRRATPGDMRRLSRKAKKSVAGGRRRAVIDDGDQLTKELLHHSVEDWRNLTTTVVDEETQEETKRAMPCDRTNRERLDENWSDFSQMWQSAATGEFDEEEELGN